ncbi:hypothetical protein ACLMJK_002894 [Lecanora helva]
MIHKFEQKRRVKAAHLFPHKSTQNFMARIFGTKDELSHPRNAMLMADYIEEQFDKGRIALVPDMSEDATDEEWRKWRENEMVRQYKIRILDKSASAIVNEVIEGGRYHGLKIIELDDKPVGFRNEYRTRARYLYYHYLECIDAQIVGHPERKQEIILNEIKKPVWPTMGSCIRKEPPDGVHRRIGTGDGTPS